MQKNTLQKTFLKCLSVLIIATSVLTFTASFYLQTKQSQTISQNILQNKIKDIKQQLEKNRQNLKNIKQLTDSIAIISARALAKIIELDPEQLKSQETLNKLQSLLMLDELHISDENGILIASIPPNYAGYNMYSSEQSKSFTPAIFDPNFEFVQQPMVRGIDGGLSQYAGVARKDSKGIVQIGFRPERLEEALKIADIKNLALNFRIGNKGSVIIIKNDKIVSAGTVIDKSIYQEETKLVSLAKTVNTPFKIDIGGVTYSGLSDNLDEYIIVGLIPDNEMYSSRDSTLHALISVNIILGILIFIAIYVLLKHMVISDIYKINSSLLEITNGKLETKIDVRNSEEFNMLSDRINTTVSALKDAIDREATRLNKELELAKAIQISSLPNIFPAFPDRDEFDIYAEMDTAKEVGGDFYDFFLVDSDHLAAIIADVSGKGIPASLFMMTAKTLLRNLTKSNMSLDDVMTMANRQIIATNSQGMFVTVFMCVIELSSGKMTYVNAGHNPPLIKRKDGNFSYLQSTPNLVLGGMDDIIYEEHKDQLEPNDILLLYTDGVTEALNNNKKMYGERHLLELLNNTDTSAMAMSDLLPFIRQDIRDFVKDAEQADDITMLAFKLNSYTNKYCVKSSKTTPADINELKRVLFWIDDMCYNEKISKSAMNKLETSIEEIFANIAMYAYPETTGIVNIDFTLDAQKKELTLVFKDNGIPYNPLAKPDPDTTLPAEERQPGGLGIFMVKNMMDDVSYKNEDGQNILTIKMLYDKK